VSDFSTTLKACDFAESCNHFRHNVHTRSGDKWPNPTLNTGLRDSWGRCGGDNFHSRTKQANIAVLIVCISAATSHSALWTHDQSWIYNEPLLVQFNSSV